MCVLVCLFFPSLFVFKHLVWFVAVVSLFCVVRLYKLFSVGGVRLGWDA